jgi:hypothetical protein
MTRLTLTILLITSVAASGQTLTVMELLQSPRQFEGRRVSVSGYYYSSWEAHMLYADLESAKRQDWTRSIWIEADLSVESPLRRAHIIGVFFYSRNYHPKQILSGFGAFGGWSSALINCTVHLKREAMPAPNHAMQRTPTRRSPQILHDQTIPPPIIARLR